MAASCGIGWKPGWLGRSWRSVSPAMVFHRDEALVLGGVHRAEGAAERAAALSNRAGFNSVVCQRAAGGEADGKFSTSTRSLLRCSSCTYRIFRPSEETASPGA